MFCSASLAPGESLASRWVRWLVLLVTAVALISCESVERRIAEDQLSSLVLQPADVPSFSQFGLGRQVTADAHAGPRKDPTRFGRLGGWIARYRPTDPAVRNGPLVLESRADLFPSAAAAKQDLNAYNAEYEATIARNGGKKLADPAVGDEARAFTFGSGADFFYVIAWRSANGTASVLVEGSAVTLDDALALASKQAARLSAATR
jgi:hypothetical protein